MTRAFDAPRDLVFEAWTEPEHVRHWWGLRTSTMLVCEAEVRPGGSWRYVTIVPEASVGLYPAGDFAQSLRLQPAETPLRLPALGYEPRPLEDLEVLGDGGQRHLEGLGQLSHRRLTGGQPGQDRAPGGVGEGPEDAAQRIGRHLLNLVVI